MRNIACLLSILIFCFINISNAQEANQRPKIYRTWVTLKSPPVEYQGVLYKINDSSIFVSNSLLLQDYTNNNFEFNTFRPNNIETIKVRKKHNIGKGTLLGGIAGVLTGVLVAKEYKEDLEDEPGLLNDWAEGMSHFIVPVYGALGAGVGAMFGTIRINIQINGKMDKYAQQKARLKKYSFK